MTVPRIIYFDLRGRAEAIRLIFEDLGEAYEDVRVPDGPAWEALRPSTPFGALPLYEEGALRFAQTYAIYRHIARTRGLYGADEAEQVACDVTSEALDELIGLVWGFFWEPGHMARVGAFVDGPLKAKLDQLQAWFRRDGRRGPYWSGDGATYADYFAFRALDEIDALLPGGLTRHPALADFHAAFAARPRIAAYAASGRRPAAFGVCIEGPKLDRRVAKSA